MGLFKHKDKTSRPGPDTLNPPNTMNPGPNHSYNNSTHDSTYYSSSNVSSNADADANSNPRTSQQVQPQSQGRTPGTTVVTTTTTTTTTTTVGADGETHTTSQPYNPTTDPPPQSETTVNQNTIPPTSSTPQPQMQSQIQQQPAPQQQSHLNLPRGQSPARKPTPQSMNGPPSYQSYQSPPITTQTPDPVPRKTSTPAGRPIPPRSELRNSISDSNSPSTYTNNSPSLPERSEARTSPNLTHSSHTTDPVPVSPTTASPGRPKTPNFSRPGTTGTSKRETLTGAIKGLHGAGEAIRGTINSGIARGLNDREEEEKMRIVREQGASEFRGSGLREGFREKAEGRMRLRRKSAEGGNRGVYGSEGPGGLDSVSERSIGP